MTPDPRAEPPREPGSLLGLFIAVVLAVLFYGAAIVWIWSALRSAQP